MATRSARNGCFEGTQTYKFTWSIFNMLHKLDEGRKHIDSQVFEIANKSRSARLNLKLRLAIKTFDERMNHVFSATLIRESAVGCHEQGVDVSWSVTLQQMGESSYRGYARFPLEVCTVSPSGDEIVSTTEAQGKNFNPFVEIENTHLNLFVEVLWRLKDVDEQNAQESFKFSFDEFRVIGKYSDVRLKCQGRDFECHKVILAQSSPVFDAMFANENFEEAQGGGVVITDMTPEDLEAFLEFVYARNCNDLAKQNAMALLAAANKYQVKCLMAAAQGELAKALNPGSAIEMLLLAKSHNAHELKKKAIQMIAKNLSEVSKQAKWQEMKNDNCDLVSLIEVFADNLRK